MRDHFSYLTDEDESRFFQKVACMESERHGVKAIVRSPAPRGMAKTASRATTFEKVAARLDRDMVYLRRSGECGLNGGMHKRAEAYLNVLRAQTDLDGAEFLEVFDKVAAAAIDADVNAAYHQLCAGLPASQHHHAREVMLKIGQECTAEAQLVKQANMLTGAVEGLEHGALKNVAKTVGHVAPEIAETAARTGRGGLRGMGEELRANAAGNRAVATHGIKTVGRGIGEAAGAVGRQARRPLDWWSRRSAANVASAPGRLGSALAKEREVAAVGGLKGVAAEGRAKSLEKSLGKANERVSAKAHKDLGYVKESPATGAPAAAKNVSAKMEAEAGKAQGAAATAARQPEAAPPPAAKPAGGAQPPSGGGPKDTKAAPPHEPEPPGGATHTPEPPGGTEGKPPGFMDAWKKVTSGGGWGALSKEEKGALIRGGVTAAMAYRVVAGKGVVTGGEGAI